MHATILTASCCTLILFWNCLPCCAQDAGSAEDVLQNMRAFDAILGSGVTVSGTIRTEQMINSRPWRTVPVNLEFRLTFDVDRCGYEMKVADHKEPAYSAEHADDKGTVIFQLRTKTWGYWGADASGMHNEVTYFHQTSDGDVKNNGTTSDSLLFGPHDAGPNMLKWTMLWSLGRDIALQIDKVESVEKMDDGRLRVAAFGRKGPGRTGKWQLDIDPAAGWMVRKAELWDDKIEDSKILEMKSTGTKWVGAFCVPTEAEMNFMGPIGEWDTHYLKIVSVAEGFDEELYKRCADIVVRNKETRLTVHDLSVSPPTMSQPNLPPVIAEVNEPTPPKKPRGAAARPGFSNAKLLFFLNLFLLFGVLAVYVIRRRARK